MINQENLLKVKNWSQFKKIFQNFNHLEINDKERFIRNKNNKNLIWFLSYSDINNAQKILDFFSKYSRIYKIIPITYYFISWKYLGSALNIEELKNKKCSINFDEKFVNSSCLGIHLFNSFLDTLYQWNKNEALELLKFWRSKIDKSTPVFSIIPYTTHEIKWFNEEFKKLSENEN